MTALPTRSVARWLAPLLVAIVAAGCRPSQTPADPNTITVAVRAAPNNLDPRIGTDETSAHVGQLIFGSLMDWGQDLRVKPNLAETLENPDPLTYIVRLHRGVKFHDGHTLTAKDVIYTYTSLLDPDSVSPYKGAFRLLQSVTALDDYTVEFKLKEPFAAFPIQLVTPPIVPDGAGDTLRRHPIGTGPYAFVRYAVDDYVELRAFADYWEGAPANSGLIIKVIPDDTMRGLELRKKSVDVVVNDMLPDVVYQLEKGREVRVARSPGVDLSYIGFNMRDPVLADRRVRHAIGYAIDRDAIVKYLRRGLARPARGVLPEQSWAFEPGARQLTYDPEQAKRLLDEAGYPDPDGDGPLPRLYLSLKVSTNEEVRLQATIVQQDLARVGIDLDIRSYEFATFYADVVKGNFQLFSLQWVGGSLLDPDILRRIFHSQQIPPVGFNRGYYHNADVDRLIDQATVARNADERKAFYGEAQKLIAEDAPYVPIWNKTNAIVAQPTLEGLHMNPVGDFLALKDVQRVGAAGATH
jgi:peptide/nickel transport system substrate-binding protein